MTKIYVVKQDGGSYSDYCLSILGIADSCSKALAIAHQAAKNMTSNDLLWDDRIFITDYELNKNYKDSTKAEIEAFQLRSNDRSKDIYHFGYDDANSRFPELVIDKCPYCGRKLGD